MTAATTIYLVRHAKAVPKKAWDGPDPDRPLDEKGFWQAPLIAESILDSLGLDPTGVVVYSSPSLRCRQTLDPLADKLAAPIQTSTLLGDLRSGPPLPPELDNKKDRKDTRALGAWMGSRGLAFLDEVVGAHQGAGIAACSHGDLIPVALDLLFDRDNVESPTSENEKGSFWTLGFEGKRLCSAAYEPAP